VCYLFKVQEITAFHTYTFYFQNYLTSMIMGKMLEAKILRDLKQLYLCKLWYMADQFCVN
jgi:hypothetical protein